MTRFILRVSYPGDDGYTFETADLGEKAARAFYWQAVMHHGPDCASLLEIAEPEQ